jgi:hypothetical protein
MDNEEFGYLEGNDKNSSKRKQNNEIVDDNNDDDDDVDVDDDDDDEFESSVDRDALLQRLQQLTSFDANDEPLDAQCNIFIHFDCFLNCFCFFFIIIAVIEDDFASFPHSLKKEKTVQTVKPKTNICIIDILIL